MSGLTGGPTDSLTDVAGVRVGQHTATGGGWLTGTTVVLAPDGGAVGGVDVRGGAPGTRETDLLDPRNLVERVHAVVLTGGSAYGLAAADGVVDRLGAAGVGFPVGGPGQVVPIVPAAVIFDLGRGGDFTARPDAGFGAAAYDAALAAGAGPVAQGSVGAGTGAVVGGLKGGVGCASAVLPGGVTVAALVVVNAVGSAVDPHTGLPYGAAYGGFDDRLQLPDPAELAAAQPATLDGDGDGDGDGSTGRALGGAGPQSLATTLGVLVTDATLTKAQCARVAGQGHDGLARAIRPAHTMLDGDTVFALATGERPAPDPAGLQALLGAAADCVTRAVVTALLSARSVRTPGGQWPSYADTFPSALRSS